VRGQKWIDWKNEQAIERTHRHMSRTAERRVNDPVGQMGEKAEKY
jgi:hypothetical protein